MRRELAESLARQALADSRQDELPVDLTAVASAIGVQDIEWEPPVPGRPEGETVWGDDGSPRLRIAGYGPRARFTLAHEIAHVLVRQTSPSESFLRTVEARGGRTLEDLCDEIAGALLLPTGHMGSIPEDPSPADLLEFASIALVSPSALAVRLRRLGWPLAFIRWTSCRSYFALVHAIGVRDQVRRELELLRPLPDDLRFGSLDCRMRLTMTLYGQPLDLPARIKFEKGVLLAVVGDGSAFGNVCTTVGP